jgi:hypothetical protein
MVLKQQSNVKHPFASIISSVVQEFGAGVRIWLDFANPAKVRFGQISGMKSSLFLDSSSGSRLWRRYKEISVKNI